jgi:hypothetical protein
MEAKMVDKVEAKMMDKVREYHVAAKVAKVAKVVEAAKVEKEEKLEEDAVNQRARCQRSLSVPDRVHE